MHKKQIKELIEKLQDSLNTAELKALNSVGANGKYPWMVGFYESTIKGAINDLSLFVNTKNKNND